MTKPKILIIEDEPLIAEDIADQCRLSGYEVCGVAYQAGKAMVMLEECRPNLVLLDINLHDEIDGTDIATYLNKHTTIPFIYITSYSDKVTLEKAKETNPLGFIVKPFSTGQIFSTIEIAWTQITRNLMPELDLSKASQLLNIEIGEREAEVLACLFKGMDNKQISETLYISPNTVKFHLKKLYEKFDVHSRMELIVFIREKLSKY